MKVSIEQLRSAMAVLQLQNPNPEDKKRAEVQIPQQAKQECISIPEKLTFQFDAAAGDWFMIGLPITPHFMN